MTWNLNQVTLPIYNALTCTCTSSGDECFEAQHFNKPWWDNYWMKVVPGVFKEVDALKATVPGAAMLFNAASSVLEQPLATKYHQQLESRIEKIARDNMELQNMVQTLEREVDSPRPKTQFTIATKPSAAESVYEKHLAPIKSANSTQPMKKNGSSLIQKRKAVNKIKGFDKAQKLSRLHSL